MKEVTLPSGANLKLGLPPFSVSKELFQAVNEELKMTQIAGATELDYNFFKNLFCIAMSSKRIDAAIQACMSKCLYNGVRFDDQTFEDEKAREDYVTVFNEVAALNLAPFMKNLMSALKPVIEMIASTQK